MMDETIGSYLSRLAEANRIDTDAMRAHIVGGYRKSVAVPVEVLAVLSGQPELSLRYAIPGLGTAAERAGLHLEHRPGPDAPARPACKLCAAARGHTGPLPRCHSYPHGAVCLRHLRWLGNGINFSNGQLDLSSQPVIVAANMAHRRFAQRHQHDIADDAYRLAHDVCHAWADRRKRQEQFIELIGTLRPGRRQLTIIDPAVHAAHYPQIVALTRLLLTPNWQTVAHQEWDYPEYVLRDLWRTASPNPYLKNDRQHRPGEPLINILPADPYKPERAA